MFDLINTKDETCKFAKSIKVLYDTQISKTLIKSVKLAKDNSQLSSMKAKESNLQESNKEYCEQFSLSSALKP